jgi:hypothetical protein
LLLERSRTERAHARMWHSRAGQSTLGITCEAVGVEAVCARELKPGLSVDGKLIQTDGALDSVRLARGADALRRCRAL